MSPETINKLGFHLTRYHGTVEGRHEDVHGWLYESFDDPKGITGRRMADASEIPTRKAGAGLSKSTRQSGMGSRARVYRGPSSSTLRGCHSGTWTSRQPRSAANSTCLRTSAKGCAGYDQLIQPRRGSGGPRASARPQSEQGADSLERPRSCDCYAPAPKRCVCVSRSGRKREHHAYLHESPQGTRCAFCDRLRPWEPL